MALNDEASALFQGFSKLSLEERLQRLVKMQALSLEDLTTLTSTQTLEPQLAEHFIENVIGYFQLPLGVATNFRINNKDYVIPMAVEETSIIAAVSKTAKWIRSSGTITTETVGDTNIGQIQIAKVSNFDRFKQKIMTNKNYLIELANAEPAKNLVKRGGGVYDIDVRQISRGDGFDMAVIHVLANTCDAMGANLIIQICEYLKAPVENISDEKVTMCILSNLNDTKLTRARVEIFDIDPEIGHKIEEASLFAHCDPYRAATHNKGVLNGIDPVLIATGNDWRAVEAGIHAYATREGTYRAITTWRMQNNNLIGTFEAPVTVGIVGGVTRLHPTAQVCLRMLGVTTAKELAEVIAAVGLVQNLGALRALITLGFTEGHMKLHITNLSLGAGATPSEFPLLQRRLEELLKLRKRVTLGNALDALNELRQELTSVTNTNEQTV